MRPSATSGSPEDALSFAACQLSTRLNACAIIVSACNLRTALGIARFRPGVPLVIITDSARLYRSLAIVHGVAPLFSGAPGLVEPHLCAAQAREWLFAWRLAQPGDQAVVLSASGISTGTAGEEADTLQVVRLG